MCLKTTDQILHTDLHQAEFHGVFRVIDPTPDQLVNGRVVQRVMLGDITGLCEALVLPNKYQGDLLEVNAYFYCVLISFIEQDGSITLLLKSALATSDPFLTYRALSVSLEPNAYCEKASDLIGLIDEITVPHLRALLGKIFAHENLFTSFVTTYGFDTGTVRGSTLLEVTLEMARLTHVIMDDLKTDPEEHDIALATVILSGLRLTSLYPSDDVLVTEQYINSNNQNVLDHIHHCIESMTKTWESGSEILKSLLFPNSFDLKRDFVDRVSIIEEVLKSARHMLYIYNAQENAFDGLHIANEFAEDDRHKFYRPKCILYN